MKLNWFIRRTKGAGSAGWLHAIIPGWAYSPLRKSFQAASLILFLFLLLWASARPSVPPVVDTSIAPDQGGAVEHAPLGEQFGDRSAVPVDAFLRLDVLAIASAALAGKMWVWALVWAGVLVGLTLVLPRFFCGYICPLGTLIDGFDWLVGGRVKRLHVRGRPWWGAARYFLMAAVLAASLMGVMLAGFIAAIPLLTRGLVFFVDLYRGTTGGQAGLPPIETGQYLAMGLLAGVLVLGLMGRRFWCRYLCPTGAVFSLVGLLRLTDRKVHASCVSCGKCVKACAFGAIQDDFSARATDCTFCQTCGGVCPAGAIHFTTRSADRQPAGPSGNGTSGAETSLSRRGFLAGGLGGLGGAAVAMTAGRLLGSSGDPAGGAAIVRPPGSIPEDGFLDACIRCGQCMKACPSGLLQPVGFQQGAWGLWTPQARFDWASCQPGCNICGQVCPTGAIRKLPLDEKQALHMGTAVVDTRTCLPHNGAECTMWCLQACRRAGHDAIEPDLPDDADFAVPLVDAHKCVGCGACQHACFAVNVRKEGRIRQAGLRVQAGPGRDDRHNSGSYKGLHPPVDQSPPEQDDPQASQPSDDPATQDDQE